MAASADPLRNTLDHLALDPAGKEDRKYLVSMLRRLGYSEREIRKAMRGGGERIIEIEYTGTGRVPRIHRPVEEDAFEVVSEEPSEFTFDEKSEFEPVEEWTEEWPDENAEEADTDETWDTDAWEVSEESTDDAEAWSDEPAEPEEELVEFHERTVEPEPEAWPDDAWDEAEDLQETEAEWEPVEEPEAEWEPVEDSPEPVEEAWEEEPEEQLVAFTVARGHIPAHEETWEEAPSNLDDQTDVAVAAGWLPVDEEEIHDPVDAPSEPPGKTWEPVEDAGDWEPVEDEEPSDAWDEADAELKEPEPEQAAWAPDEVAEAEEAVDAMPDSGYAFEDYQLYTRSVELTSGRKQRIYFFAKNEPKSGEPAALPEGYVVERNSRTGLPFLRRSENQPPAPSAPEADEGDLEEVRCHALTQNGTQCKRGARENSKYCGTHKGWRGPRVE